MTDEQFASFVTLKLTNAVSWTALQGFAAYALFSSMLQWPAPVVISIGAIVLIWMGTNLALCINKAAAKLNNGAS